MAACGSVQADEYTRRAQEELRRRNLYFGDIDGRVTPEFKGAVRRYQERKGFEKNGELDEATAASLNIPATGPAHDHPPNQWPDVIILKSDAARVLPKLEIPSDEKPLDEPDLVPSPAAPAESPAPVANLPSAEVDKFVDAYLRDAATDNVQAQVKYYEFPVEYFDHGPSDYQSVWRDTRNYVKRWPKRKYGLTGPIALSGTDDERQLFVQFTIDFSVTNAKSSAHGQTRNFWTITRRPGGEMKIVSIREERLRN